MPNPVVILVSIALFACFFLLLPVALATYTDYRRSKTLRCPETGGPASVRFDAGRAVKGALFGKVTLRVAECSLWPEKKGCAGACSAEAVEQVRTGK